MQMNKFKSIVLTMMMMSGYQINAETVNSPKINENTQSDYVMMRVEQGSEAIVGGNFDQYVIDIKRMAFKKVFAVSLDNIESHWGETKELFVSRVNKNSFVIKVIKNDVVVALEPPKHMMNTKVQMTVIKYTVLGL